MMVIDLINVMTLKQLHLNLHKIILQQCIFYSI